MRRQPVALISGDAMHPLDKLIWNALSIRQAGRAEGGAQAKRMRAEYGPFAAAGDNASAEAVEALAALIPEGGDISLLEPAPPRPPASVRAATRAGIQMTATALTADAARFAIEPLSDADAAEMLALALLTKPGPFRNKTHLLGRFIGIRDGGRLVAMAGERLQIEGFIEVSAVCTHPDYRGRGFGAALLRAVGARILAEGATPFLHSYADNAGAIALYRKLGFELRCPVTHAVWSRAL